MNHRTHIKIVELDGAPVDGPEWTTDADGTHTPVTRPAVDERPYLAAAADAVEELLAARAKFAPMRGPHEGYAVLLEEVDELWDEVRRHKADPTAMRAEAVQIAAMAIAFIVEVCNA